MGSPNHRHSPNPSLQHSESGRQGLGQPRQASATAAREISPPKPGALEEDCRCRCGGLVARIVEAGVEIKCRRCKRDLLVPWSARDTWVAPIEVEDRVLPFERSSS